MSRDLPQTIKLSTYTTTKSTGGQAKRTLSSEAFVAGNLQPDTSAEVTLANVQAGIVTGKLYLASTTSVNHETMRAFDEDLNEWEIVGPPVNAARARTQWVPVRRRLRT